jgi:hypothetical protein
MMQIPHSGRILEDFGTGYSSLSYLKNLPVNNMKIDRAFIKDICKDENDKKIVKMLINMAHSMNMIVTAEGVEDQDQFDLLTEYACDEIQGYLLSKPLPAYEVTELLINPELLGNVINSQSALDLLGLDHKRMIFIDLDKSVPLREKLKHRVKLFSFAKIRIISRIAGDTADAISVAVNLLSLLSFTIALSCLSEVVICFLGVITHYKLAGKMQSDLSVFEIVI